MWDDSTLEHGDRTESRKQFTADDTQRILSNKGVKTFLLCGGWDREDLYHVSTASNTDCEHEG